MVVPLTSGCRDSAPAEDTLVEVLAAASVGAALRDVAAGLPLDVRVELMGSRTAVAKLRDLRPRAVIVTADAELLAPLLAEGVLRATATFAANALVLAYNQGTPGGRALAAGEPVAELTQGAELLAVLVDAAEAVSDAERAAHWREVGAAREAAERVLGEKD